MPITYLSSFLARQEARVSVSVTDLGGDLAARTPASDIGSVRTMDAEQVRSLIKAVEDSDQAMTDGGVPLSDQDGRLLSRRERLEWLVAKSYTDAPGVTRYET